jgi:hypothetical protein
MHSIIKYLNIMHHEEIEMDTDVEEKVEEDLEEVEV